LSATSIPLKASIVRRACQSGWISRMETMVLKSRRQSWRRVICLKKTFGSRQNQTAHPGGQYADLEGFHRRYPRSDSMNEWWDRSNRCQAFL
jgi:hypothetical protein